MEPNAAYCLRLTSCSYLQNTYKRSALRITRESELLGSQLVAYHTREVLVIEAKFLREDLPYFTELLGEVISQTKYTRKPMNA
jgi:ubiquinol-cytochrome c reductase core subunit 2